MIKIRAYFLIWLVIGWLKLSNALLRPLESRTRSVKNLDGLWKFRLAPEWPIGEDIENVTIKPIKNDFILIPVPASFNDVTTNETIRNWRGFIHYETSFNTPIALSDEQVIVHFGSVQYLAYVFVNERFVGKHEGGHLPFAFAIDFCLHPFSGSKNRLTVIVSNALSPETIPPAVITKKINDSLLVYPENYEEVTNCFDFFNYAGLHRPVNLYIIPSNGLESIFWRSEGETDSSSLLSPNLLGSEQDLDWFNIFYSLKFANNNFDVADMYCSIKVLDESRIVIAKTKSCTNGTLRIKARVWQPVAFTTARPYMYYVHVNVFVNGSLYDEYEFRTGFRNVKWNEHELIVNGRPIYLTGFGKHEDSELHGRGFDPVINIRDMSLIHWIGGNSFRTSHYPYSEQLMDLADEQGVLIINEVPAVGLYQFNDQLRILHEHMLQELIERDIHHPSTIAWSIANEPKSQLNSSDNYWKTITDFARSLDPTRPLTAALNVDYDQDHAAKYLDILMINRYYAWYSDPGLANLIPLQLTTDINRWSQTFKKPILISEYGADTVAGMHSLENRIFSEDFQTIYLKKHFSVFDILKQKGILIGEHIWNFADFMTDSSITRVMGNKKGIFTRTRQPKTSAKLLRCRYHKIQAKQRNLEFIQDEDMFC